MTIDARTDGKKQLVRLGRSPIGGDDGKVH